jgi:hypothetical protein
MGFQVVNALAVFAQSIRINRRGDATSTHQKGLREGYRFHAPDSTNGFYLGLWFSAYNFLANPRVYAYKCVQG